MRRVLIQTVPCIAVGAVLGYLSTNWSWLPYHPLLVGLIAALAFRGVLYLRSMNAKKFRKNEEYGSARWRVES